MMKTLPLAVVAFAVMLGGCSQSEADRKQEERINDLVASTKTCGDYAALAAQSNCIRFVEEQRKTDSAFGKNASRLVHALEAHWDKSCATQLQDIQTLELKTTVALTRKGPLDDKAKSAAICKDQVEESLKAYPALANDRSNFTR
jgi:hypothetical protein